MRQVSEKEWEEWENKSTLGALYAQRVSPTYPTPFREALTAVWDEMDARSLREGISLNQCSDILLEYARKKGMRVV